MHVDSRDQGMLRIVVHRSVPVHVHVMVYTCTVDVESSLLVHTQAGPFHKHRSLELDI